MNKNFTGVLLSGFLCFACILSACGGKPSVSNSNSLSQQSGSAVSISTGESKDSSEQSDTSGTSNQSSLSSATGDSSANSSSGNAGSSSASSSGSKSGSSSLSRSSSASHSTSTSRSSSAQSSTVSSSRSSSTSSGSTVKYYAAGSWNGYLVNDEFYEMTLVPGSTKLYTVTVVLTAENRDSIYDGHWYKVTEGNWNHSYGIDNYVLQPAPVKKTEKGEPIGLGSIWIDDNMTLTIRFNSVTKIVYDNADGKSLPSS